MEGNGRESPWKAPPMKGPRSSNLVYSMMAYVHGELALLEVDFHEVGDLLALTNSLIQPHNHKEGGSQVTPNQSRRHHPPKGNRCGSMMNSLLLCFKR